MVAGVAPDLRRARRDQRQRQHETEKRHVIERHVQNRLRYRKRIRHGMNEAVHQTAEGNRNQAVIQKRARVAADIGIPGQSRQRGRGKNGQATEMPPVQQPTAISRDEEQPGFARQGGQDQHQVRHQAGGVPICVERERETQGR